MKKKILSVVFTASMLAAILCGCGSSKGTTEVTDAATTNSGSSYEEKKVLRVAMECAYAPFNWTQESEEVSNGEKAVKISNSDGYAYGYDVKTAQMIADYLGWDLEIHKTEWSSIVLGLDAGDYDCIIGGMCYSEERDQTLDFTTPYYVRDCCLAVSDSGKFADITGISQFEGLDPVCTTQLGTNFPDYFTQIPSYQEGTQYETTSEAFMAVQNGTADVVVMDVPTTKSALSTMSGLKILELSDDDGLTVPEGSSNDVCIAVREGDSELQELIQGAMDASNWNVDNKDQFDAQMDEMIEVQPAAN